MPLPHRQTELLPLIIEGMGSSMNRSTRLRALGSLLLFLATTLAAQNKQQAEPTKPEQEAVVCEQLVTKIDFANDGTSVAELHARMRILSPAGVRQYGLLSFSYAKANAGTE